MFDCIKPFGYFLETNIYLLWRDVAFRLCLVHLKFLHLLIFIILNDLIGDLDDLFEERFIELGGDSMMIFQQLRPDHFAIDFRDAVSEDFKMFRFFEIKLQVVFYQMLEYFFLVHVLNIFLFADFSKLGVDVFLLWSLLGRNEFHLNLYY